MTIVSSGHVADDIDEQIEELKKLAETGTDAFCQTLLQSLKDGGSGYCGIMCNFHPKLYNWLCDNFDKEPEKAERLQAMLGTVGFTEGGLPYPLTAKYHMNLVGIPTENVARNRKAEEMTDYAKDCMAQMKLLSDFFEKEYGLV